MPHRIRILNGDEEFLLVEDPGVDPTNLPLRVFAQAGSSRFRNPDTPIYKTEQGEWIPVAVYKENTIAPLCQVTTDQLELFKTMVTRYLDERERDRQYSRSSCYYLLCDGRPAAELIRMQPGGLVLLLFTARETAEQARKNYGDSAAVKSTGALREFLALRAEEGYAGALLDGDQPVYWCVDQDSQIQFLKLSATAEKPEVSEFLLNDRGEWEPYEGDEELELFEDQDLWDQLMADVFGSVPFVGYEPKLPHYTLYEDGSPQLFAADPDEEQVQTIMPIFHEPHAARKYADDREQFELQVGPVEDLRQDIRHAMDAGAVALLHPGDHRAKGGTLWLDGDRLVLDSFSGFWQSSDGSVFSQS